MDRNLKQLHETDFNLWVEETKKAIQNRDFSNMDWDNLLDEIDDMGKSEKRSLDSYMQRLVEHILKLKYWRATPHHLRVHGNAREEAERERCGRG